jgi:hypothetical protein
MPMEAHRDRSRLYSAVNYIRNYKHVGGQETEAKPFRVPEKLEEKRRFGFREDTPSRQLMNRATRSLTLVVSYSGEG